MLIFFVLHLIAVTVTMWIVYKSHIASSRKQVLYFLAAAIPVIGVVGVFALLDKWKYD